MEWAPRSRRWWVQAWFVGWAAWARSSALTQERSRSPRASRAWLIQQCLAQSARIGRSESASRAARGDRERDSRDKQDAQSNRCRDHGHRHGSPWCSRRRRCGRGTPRQDRRSVATGRECADVGRRDAAGWQATGWGRRRWRVDDGARSHRPCGDDRRVAPVADGRGRGRRVVAGHHGDTRFIDEFSRGRVAVAWILC